MSKSFSGRWHLNLDESTSQIELLKLMKRKSWEISMIDKANEEFLLFHFVTTNDNNNNNENVENKSSKFLHALQKKVKISLDSDTLSTLSSIASTFGLDGNYHIVEYEHFLKANGEVLEHKDDSKSFGDCSSITTMEKRQDKVGFSIRWLLRSGVLSVFHFINEKNQLQVEMTMISNELVKPKKQTTCDSKHSYNDNSYKTNRYKQASCVKIYERVNWKPADLVYITELEKIPTWGEGLIT